jgi:hypothetical protein
MIQPGKLEWFGGNEDALQVYRMLIRLAHVWDDLVDKDREVTEDAINEAFLIALVYLPLNPFYRNIQYAIAPMWISVVSAYSTANFYERNKDEHGIEIAHNLRYAAGNIVAYMIHICVGAEEAKKHMPEVWKDMVAERFDSYREEHLNV